MITRSSLAAAALVVGGMVGCASPTDAEDPSEDTPAEDLPLDITVDSLDIVHGALRISATMVDGAADVSVRLGGDCEHAEVGGGISTLSTLVWALGEKDVAEAIGCGLLVRARVRDGRRHVTKTAELPVGVDMVSAGSDLPEDAPQRLSISPSPAGVAVGFSQVTRSAHLTTSDSILYAVKPDTEEDPSTSDNTAQFMVPRVDFARSLLRQRPFSLDGVAFQPLVSVGSLLLQDEPADSVEFEDGPEEEPMEPEPESGEG